MEECNSPKPVVTGARGRESVVRVGVVGCGQFMSRQHIPTIHHSPRLRLEHLATRSAEKARHFAAKYDAAKYSTRWEDVVSDPDVDVVVVGVLPWLHPRIARASLANGKPVYVEKPLAETAEECIAIQRTAMQRGLPVAVGFNRRFAPATKLVATALGNRDSPVSLTYRISDDDRIRPPAQRWKLGCRLHIEVVHIFDLLFHLLQEEPVSVYARETRTNDALVMLDFQNGSRASILSSPWGSLAQPKEHLEAILDHGALEMEDFVEVRAYGLEGVSPVTRFAGRAYDDCDNSHVDAYAREGRAALLTLRKRYNDAFLKSGVLADSSSETAWRRARELLGTPPPAQINYSMDKGWGAALEEFCLAAAAGEQSRNANAVDGIRATACATAARTSIEKGVPIALDSAEWRVTA